jgi:hypothetical protein
VLVLVVELPITSAQTKGSEKEVKQPILDLEVTVILAVPFPSLQIFYGTGDVNMCCFYHIKFGLYYFLQSEIIVHSTKFILK